MSGLLNENDSLSRMQQHYWTTKQVVFRKFGKKEDDCIIASDMELDLKVELFQAIEESFLLLMRVLENYQERLCVLAQEENILGRFLKENGKQDKTRAGKAMWSAGKALSYCAQLRLTLRIPLIRLYQEVETFQYRAIVDTLQTIEKMEKARNSYRGTLMWMKDVSQQLDPDTCKQLEKFRKVQSQVRKAKQMFDNLKLDTLQKIDLLSFSRCNLFSQALSSYQAALLNVAKKVAHTSTSVALTTKGYQHYEFSMLKELTETSKKLAEDVSDFRSYPSNDKDTELFFDAEYHDDVENKLPVKELHTANDDSVNKLSYNSDQYNDEKCFPDDSEDGKVDEDLLDLKERETLRQQLPHFMQYPLNDGDAEDTSLSSEWQAVFGDDLLTPSKLEKNEVQGNEEGPKPGFFPSQLINADKSPMHFENNQVKRQLNDSSKPTMGTRRAKEDISAWFNLFAELDPLANPDLIGKRKDEPEERNC